MNLKEQYLKETGYSALDIPGYPTKAYMYWLEAKVQGQKPEDKWLSPVPTERKMQEEKLKQIWPHYPNVNYWQCMNGLLEFTIKYIEQQAPKPEESEEETVVLKGTLKVVNTGTRELCQLILNTPASYTELTRGSFMHCNNIRDEIIAYD